MFRWNTAFINIPADRFDEACAFWTAVSGTRLSERRGEHREFATLLPEQGDPCLRVQVVGAGGGAHLDLDVDLDNLPVARTLAWELGATIVADYDTYSVLRSPQGQPFCLTTDRGTRVPPPVAAPDGTLSRVDQVSLDIGSSGFEGEAQFWSALTGWPLRPATEPEFARLGVPEDLPIRILLQRLQEDRPATAHVDIACSDVEAIATWHQKLGAQRVSSHAHWTVMTDPVGGSYCLTGRSPVTGKVSR